MSVITRILLLVVYVVVIAGLITAIILSFSHKTSAPGISSSKPQTSTTSKPKSNSSNASSNQNSSNATASASSGPSSSTQTLSNSGPGNVIAVFIGASTLGALIHWRYNKHKLYLNQ